MNRETLAAYKWLASSPAGDACNQIVRLVQGNAYIPTADKVQKIADQIRENVMAAFPSVIRPGEPDDMRETMRAGLARVDWVEIALLFIEHEHWRAEGRRRREKRKLARKRRT